jgi:hypothetical protein
MPETPLPVVAAFQGFRRGRIWGFGDTDDLGSGSTAVRWCFCRANWGCPGRLQQSILRVRVSALTSKGRGVFLMSAFRRDGAARLR